MCFTHLLVKGNNHIFLIEENKLGNIIKQLAQGIAQSKHSINKVTVQMAHCLIKSFSHFLLYSHTQAIWFRSIFLSFPLR